MEKVIRDWKSRPYDKTFFPGGEMPPHPTLFLEKSVYEEIGYLDLISGWERIMSSRSGRWKSVIYHLVDRTCLF